MTAPAVQAPAEHAAAMRANLSFVEKLLDEAMYEYTSKERMRRIAVIGLATLQAMYANAAEQAEMAQAPETGSLIIPATEMPSGAVATAAA